MIKLTLESFLEKYNSNEITMTEGEVHRVCNCPIYHRDSNKSSNKGFEEIDSGS